MSESFTHRRRGQNDAQMDITPMIDITFLLLIFFLVASKMDQGVEVALPQARNGTAVTEKSSAVICLVSRDMNQPVVYLGDKTSQNAAVNTADPAAQEQAVIAYVNQELAQGKQQVIVRADKTARHRDVNRLMRAIASARDIPIYVAVLEQN